MLTLDETLNYKNKKIINKFLMSFNVTEADAEDIFLETLKWLWLCAKSSKDRELNTSGAPQTLTVQSGILIIDEFWHVFILNTRDYADFCDKYLGMFVHHAPSDPNFKPLEQAETEVQMAYIYDHLGGAAALKKWYKDYAQIYPPEKIKQIRKEPLDYLEWAAN